MIESPAGRGSSAQDRTRGVHVNRKMLRPSWIAVMLALIAASTLAPICGAMDAANVTSLPDSTRPAPPAMPAPVVFGQDTLFTIQTRLGPFSPADRARAVEERMARLADDPLVTFDSVVVAESEASSDLVAAPIVLMSVTDADADAAGKPRHALAVERAEAITRALHTKSFWASIKVIALGVLFSVIATAVLGVILKMLGRGLRWVQRVIAGWRGTRIRPLRIQKLELLSADHVANGLAAVARLLRLVLVVVLVYFYVPLVLSFFPWTRTLGATLLGYVVHPLRQTGLSALGYVPKLLAIAVIVVVTRYLLKLIHLLFRSIESGSVQFEGFHRDWADPTYKITRFLVIAFALVVIFPYLPGSGSDAFKGVSIFFGLLLSLGSSSAIGNAVAGTVITYMRPFKAGDRVQIANTTGDVIERTLLVTRIRTIKNVDVTIPNAMVLSSHIVNYSSCAAERGLILNTTVTIGYDAPWKTVHELLLSAADATENILKEPRPFVFQTSLDDSYVSYELNAYTDKPSLMAETYSKLHQSIQDKFNEAGVEIMSPLYAAVRDGNHTTVPQDYLPPSYRTPSFGIQVHRRDPF